MTANTADYNFITDRLAIGNVASRAVPGFCVVVTVLTVEGRHRGRPWSAKCWLSLRALAGKGPR
jgi:hypothetical protein